MMVRESNGQSMADESENRRSRTPGGIDPSEFPSDGQDFDTEFADLIERIESGDIPMGGKDSAKAYELYRNAMDTIEDGDEIAVASARNMLRAAITLDPYCYDAQRALALLTGSVEERAQRLSDLVTDAKAHYESMHLLDNTMGDAWSNYLLRPYLRLKSELAYSYFDQGRYTLSLRECTDLLELTRSDTQGIRCLTMIIYAYFEDLPSAMALYDRFDGERNVWFLMSLAVLAYKFDDRTKSSFYLSLLNDYCPSALPMYISGNYPDVYADNYERGSIGEAAAAFDDVSLLLDTTYGFVDWLMNNRS